ncbi:MAG: hypothetical protein ACK47B_20770 [Armatimonadota bacterium]
MPQFSEIGGFQTASFITGPSHVLLGLRFGAHGSAQLTLHRRPPIGTCSHGQIDEVQLERAIRTGVDRANAERGTKCGAVEAFYIENDSPKYSLYERCTYLLTLRAGDDASESADG